MIVGNEFESNLKETYLFYFEILSWYSFYGETEGNHKNLSQNSQYPAASLSRYPQNTSRFRSA